MLDISACLQVQMSFTSSPPDGATEQSRSTNQDKVYATNLQQGGTKAMPFHGTARGKQYDDTPERIIDVSNHKNNGGERKLWSTASTWFTPRLF